MVQDALVKVYRIGIRRTKAKHKPVTPSDLHIVGRGHAPCRRTILHGIIFSDDPVAMNVHFQ